MLVSRTRVDTSCSLNANTVCYLWRTRKPVLWRTICSYASRPAGLNHRLEFRSRSTKSLTGEKYSMKKFVLTTSAAALLCLLLPVGSLAQDASSPYVVSDGVSSIHIL